MKRKIIGLAIASMSVLLASCGANKTTTESTSITISEADNSATGQTPKDEVHTHTYVEHAKVEATCTTTGTDKYFTCSGCNKLFSDKNGTEITAAPVLAKVAHSYAENTDAKYLVSAANCENKAVYKKSCSVCGEVGTETFEYGEIGTDHIPATDWTTTETEHYHVSDCSHAVESDRANHSFSSENVCTVCEYCKEPVSHLAYMENNLFAMGDYSGPAKKTEGLTYVGKPSTNDYTGSTEKLVISKDGTYVLTGNYTDGISIEKGKTVTLILNNVDINSITGVAIETGKDCNITISLPDGTNNTITNDYDDKNAIHVKGTLLINGTGKLTVTSNTKNAIKCSSTLRIINSVVYINAANHGISCETAIINGSYLDIKAAKDGINAEQETSEFTLAKGYVSLCGTTYFYNGKGDGIQSNSFVSIDDCTIGIVSTNEFVIDNAENRELYGLEDKDFIFKKDDDDKYIRVNGETGNYALPQSGNAIKANGEFAADYGIYIINTTLAINTYDTAISSDGYVFITNQGSKSESITTSDVGIYAKKDAFLMNGVITINANVGVEATHIEIDNNANINIESYNYCIKASKQFDAYFPDIFISAATISYDSQLYCLYSEGRILVNKLSYISLEGELYSADYGVWDLTN